MKISKLLLLQLLFALSVSLRAGDETRSCRIYANQVGPWAFVQAHDDKFTGVAGWAGGFTMFSNRAMIEFGLNEDKHNFFTAPVKLCAKFDVEVTDAALNVAVYTNQQLDINYDPNELTKYKDKVQLVFSPAYKIKVYNITITQCPVSSNCSGCTTPYTKNDVYLQAEVYSEKAYNTFNFSSTFVATDITNNLNSTTQQVDVSWNYVLGAEEYELEYTFVDKYTGTSGTFLAATTVSYNMEHDATRIITNYNTYSIPLVYENGFIVYRIRPISYNASRQRIEGTWFGAPVSGAVASAIVSSDLFYVSVNTLNDIINWQSIKTFAEHGKTGVGVRYSDATGLPRQSLARTNTDNKTVVGSTLYDFYGRPTINILPVPVSGIKFDYRTGLNKYLTAVFDKTVFGLCGGTTPLCNASSTGMDISNGASNYYSANNANKLGYQGYLPDAEGFPYTQVKYSADERGRITHQTLPGAAHSLGSGKEWRYFYTQPMQVELDRLFGREAGRSKYYYKKITLDPNNQASAVYSDMYGRIVAASLIGVKPLNVDAIPNVSLTVSLTEDLALAPTNDKNPDTRCNEVNVDFFVSSASVEGYVYNTTLGSFVSPCDVTTCYNCVYDVALTISDDCGAVIYDFVNNGSAPSTIGQVAPYIPILCGTGITSTLIMGASLSAPLQVTFPKPGVYTVHKKICVSDAPMDAYTTDLITNGCLNKKCDIVDSILGMTDFSSCGNPATTCAQCLTELQTYTTIAASSSPTMMLGTPPYTVAVETPSMTPQQLNKAIENCQKLCPPKTRCDKYTKQLLADFYPGTGQYAVLSSSDPKWSYSIFKSANSLTNSPTYSTPPTPYLNGVGAPDYVLLPNTTVPVLPQNLSQADFITYFKNSWANSFLTSHPEYCKLYFNCSIIGASQDYNDEMNDITHFDAACSGGFMVPVPGIYSTFSVQGCSQSNPDPIVALGATYPLFAAAISSFTNELKNNFNGTGLGTSLQGNVACDIYRYVISQSIPSASTAATSDYVGDTDCRKDIDWLKFKSAYQSKKFALIQTLLGIYISNMDCVCP